MVEPLAPTTRGAVPKMHAQRHPHCAASNVRTTKIEVAAISSQSTFDFVIKHLFIIKKRFLLFCA
jgi:hypothetical protein